MLRSLISMPIARAAMVNLVLSAGAIGPADAGAWVMGTDEAYLRLGGWSMSTRDRFDFAGERMRIVDEEGRQQEYGETAIAFYAALGLWPDLELNLSSLIKRARLEDASETITTDGLSDLNAALKLGLGDRPVVRSIQVGVKVPTGYDDEVDPPLGDGQFDVEGRVLLGVSLWSLGVPGYAGIEGGYRHREGRPSDAWVFLAELGSAIFHDVGFRVKLDGSYAREIPGDNESATDLFALDKRATRVDGTFWAEVASGVFVELGFTHILSARNFTAGDTWNLGLVRKLEL